MDEQKTLTLDPIRSLTELAYALVWTSYDDNLDNHRGLIRKCLNNKNREYLWEEADVWYSDAKQETVRGIIAKLKKEYTVFGDFDEGDVGGFFDEHEDEIHGEIYSRSDSDVTRGLIMHAGGISIRVEMPSSYDCINSHWFESQGGYRCEKLCFGNMVDSLNLNPTRIKRVLTKHGYKAYGHFPNRKNRNNREQVSYEQFYEELINFCYGANLLTYIGRVSLKELYKAGFSLEEVVIPKGNCCELFSSTYDGESPLEMELKEDVRLKLKVKDYYGFRFRLDDERSKYEYSIRHVYGVGGSFFGERISLAAS